MHDDRNDAPAHGAPPHPAAGFTSAVLGAALVVGGLLYFAYVMGWMTWERVSPWDLWPLVLIVPGIRGWRNTHGVARIVAGLFIVVGVATLALELGLLDGAFEAVHGWLAEHDVDPRVLWAVVFVLAGVMLMSGGRFFVTRHIGSPRDRLAQLAVFGGSEVRPASTDFRGGWIAAFCGGHTIDLRDCSTTADEVRIDVIAIFGGADIKVPRHWEVVLTGLPIFGGFSDETRHEPRPGERSPRLIVNGFVMFGGFGVDN